MSNYPTNLIEKQRQIIKLLLNHKKEIEKVHSEKLQMVYSMSTRPDVSGECSPQILLFGKRSITIFENGNMKEFRKNC